MADQAHIKKDLSCQEECSCQATIHLAPFVQKYVHHRNLLARGQIETGLFLYPYTLAVMTGVFVKVVLGFSTECTGWITGLVMVGIGLFQHRMGWLYDKWGIIQADEQWRLERSPLLVEMAKDVKKGEKL